jgi:predicted GIY-YIG superfamily endonuclease
MVQEETDCGLLYGTLSAFTGRTVEHHKETARKQTRIHQPQHIFVTQNQELQVSALN